MARNVADSHLETPERYSKALSQCETVAHLRAVIAEYAELAVDAAPIVERMTDAEFVEFRRGLFSERHGQFAGQAWAERYGAVLMPEPMFTVARIATEYCAPFNVALRRIKEVRPELLQAKAEGR